MLRTCIDLFQSYTAVDYEIFADHFSVLGVMCSLRPWRRKVPDPYLSSACAPLRLLIEGDMRQWHVHAVEDMRLMSHNQLHLPVDEANWHFHLFGVKEGDVGADLLHPPPDSCDGDPDGPRGSSSRARRAASSAQPAAPLAAPPAPSERGNDGGKRSILTALTAHRMMKVMMERNSKQFVRSKKRKSSSLCLTSRKSSSDFSQD